MNMTEGANQEPPKRASIPLWFGLIAATLVWDGLPWVISLLTPRFGWAAALPGHWNWLGLIPVVVGSIGLYWGLLQHSARTPSRIDMELAKTYLLSEGAYRYSRNPMYLSELALLFGWAIFYGSVALLIVFAAWWAFFNFYQIPREEAVLEASFGESYREYKNRVARWFGKPGG